VKRGKNANKRKGKVRLTDIEKTDILCGDGQGTKKGCSKRMQRNRKRKRESKNKRKGLTPRRGGKGIDYSQKIQGTVQCFWKLMIAGGKQKGEERESNHGRRETLQVSLKSSWKNKKERSDGGGGGKRWDQYLPSQPSARFSQSLTGKAWGERESQGGW